MKVLELMKTDLFTISPEITVREGMQQLAKHRITGLPVVDENKKILGMLTEKEFIKSGLPSYYSQVQNLSYLPDFKPFEEKLIRVMSMKVSEIMRKDVITVNADLPIVEVARIMVTSQLRRVPVVNENNILVGMIARSDIVRYINKKAGLQ